MENWFNRVSVDKNIDLILRWAEYYNIKNCTETYVDGISALRFFYKNRTYIAAIEKDYERLRILSPSTVKNSKSNSVHIVESIGENGYVYGDNCWVRLFKQIAA